MTKHIKSQQLQISLFKDLSPKKELTPCEICEKATEASLCGSEECLNVWEKIVFKKWTE